MTNETFRLEDVARVTGGDLQGANRTFSRFVTDSRSIYGGSDVCFVAIKTARHDGHLHIEEAFAKGVRCFLVTSAPSLIDASFVVVESPLTGLQKFAAHHRSKFDIPVYAITGSNGKTIVKEWLHQLLAPEYRIKRSPRSFNSQIGVPLSVLNLASGDQLGLFEAGISHPGEMHVLQGIIQPTDGIFSHLGNAHLENFSSINQLVSEKCRLFSSCKRVFYRADQAEIKNALTTNGFQGKHCTWSFDAPAMMVVAAHETHYEVDYNQQKFIIHLPFTDKAYVANAFTCLLVMLENGYSSEECAFRLHNLRQLNMRLERMEGWNGTRLISDVYTNDLHALELAIEELGREKGVVSKIAVLSDIVQTGIPAEQLYGHVGQLLQRNGIDLAVVVGPEISKHRHLLAIHTLAFSSTDALLGGWESVPAAHSAVLFKGARHFGFERLVTMLQRKAHATVLEVNLNNLTHNLNHYRALLPPRTQVMAMVKAFGYGTGGADIAEVLEFNRVDYLGVAYVDEGVALRKAGIQTPIMVMNPDERAFPSLLEHHLEPEIYSLHQLEALRAALGNQSCSIHLKLDTGMHRLGFQVNNLMPLIEVILSDSRLRVVSVLSHLAASDNQEFDDFTRAQLRMFNDMCTQLRERLGHGFTQHIANTSGVRRFPEAHYDMVRLGIGLYGIASDDKEKAHLHPVATFKTTVSQLRIIEAGESVGYNRSFMAERTSTIATIPVGYADGLMRTLSNGKGRAKINGQWAPYVGRVCMDMTMLDVTGLAVQEGDEVILFGDSPSIEEIATSAGTIPYEIIAGISQRVKRIFIRD